MPDKVPLWNGPLRIKTPPAAPLQLSGDGSVIEFLLPYPIHILDSKPWEALQTSVGGVAVTIERPATVPIDTPVPGAFCNDTPDLFCTVIRVLLPSVTSHSITEMEVYGVVQLMLQWLRILGRQYWVLHGTTGVSAYCRGAIFSCVGNKLSQENFATYGKTVLVRPLAIEAWNAIRKNSALRHPIPVSESIFCDALMSVASRDDVKALVELGLAAEIELTGILGAVVASRPNDKAAVEFLKRKERRMDKFQWKLETACVALGLTDPATFHIAGGPAGWKDQLLLLYKFRGSVAHSGQAVVLDGGRDRVITTAEVTSFIFAVEALFHWAAEQRRLLSLTEYEHPWKQFYDRPIHGVLNPAQETGGFSGRSGPTTWIR
jgi:hypothetical protein